MKRLLIFSTVLFLSTSVFAYLGPENSNYYNEGRLMETEYRLARHIPQQANNGVVIAVIDFGVETTLEAFSETDFWVNEDEVVNGIDSDSNGFVDDVHGWNFNDNTNNPEPDQAEWHGSFVAGMIVANQADKGVIGVHPEATIMNIRNKRGNDEHKEAADSIRYAADNIDGNCIINMSFGYIGDEGYMMRDALEYAYNKGCFLITSAGNDGFNVISFSPAKYPQYVVSVTGLDTNETSRHPQSNFGEGVRYAAPFWRVFGVWDDMYHPISGTSFSAPIIAGLAGLIWGNDPSLTREQVIAKLDEHRVLIMDSESSTDYGKINVESLVNSYVNIHTKTVQTDIDNDGYQEQLILEISTDKTTGAYNKGFLAYIVEEDGTRYAVFSELR